VMGKFLSYIPITIFVTLLASLFLASSVNNALFRRLNKNFKYYFIDNPDAGEDEELFMNNEEREILVAERKAKIALPQRQQPRTDTYINKVAARYAHLLHKIVDRAKWRRSAIW